MCKFCGRWGVKEIRTTINKSRNHCKFCNKKMGIKKSSELGLALINKGPYSSGRDAAIICQELNLNKRDIHDKKQFN